MELIQGVDVNFVMPCMLPGHVSKGPFHSYGVRRHLVNRARNDVLHPRKSPTGPLKNTPHPRAQMAGLVPVVARGIVTGLTFIAPCINDSLAQSKAPFPWLGQGVCTFFKLFFFSVLTEIFDLEEIHNDRIRLWAFFLPLILYHGKLRKPSG